MNNNNIALAFDYLEEVNYALVQSKMNICNWCIIENNSDADLENILLEISGEYVEKYVSMPFRLDAKQRIRIQDIKLQVKIDNLLSLTEKVASNLTLRIRTAEEILKEQVFPISFMAYNQWNGTDCYPQLLASFITPNLLSGSSLKLLVSLEDERTTTLSLICQSSFSFNIIKCSVSRISS